jgi:hypothetical protein
MTLSKDIWSLIFKCSQVKDFLNLMLVEKSAYNGFKINASPTLTFHGKQTANSFEIHEANVFCQLCEKYMKTDEIFVQPNDCFNSSDLSSPCCMNILCPKCVQVSNDGKITLHYLFIESIVYIQEDEMFDCDCCDNKYMYMWVPCTKVLTQKEISSYRTVKTDCNSYTTKKMEHYLDWDDDWDNLEASVDYTDIYAKCICKNCGFTCGARNYLDSKL